MISANLCLSDDSTPSLGESRLWFGRRYYGRLLHEIPQSYLVWLIAKAGSAPRRTRRLVAQFLEESLTEVQAAGVTQVTQAGPSELQKLIAKYKFVPEEPASSPCKKCGVVDLVRLRWQRFANGGLHIRKVCAVCNEFISFASQTPDNIRQANEHAGGVT